MSSHRGINLLTEVSIASFPGHRTVYVKNRLAVCIDELRDFELLHAAIRSITVVAACCISFVERSIDRAVLRRVVQLR